MREPPMTRFEADLADALDTYAQAAPIAVDPAAVTRTAIAATPAGRSTAAARSWNVARPAMLLAALLALLIAVLLASGAVPLPGPAPPARSRILVSDGVTTWIVGPDRIVEASGQPSLSRGSCGWLIGGTTTLMANAYSTWEFRSLTDEPLPVVDAGASYGGGERWSPDRRKVALIAVTDERLTILDFTEATAPVTTTWDIPGLIGAGWMPGSEALLVASRMAPDTVVIQERTMDGPLGEPQRLDIGPGPANPGEMELIQLSVSPDGRAAILTGVVTGGDASQVPPPTEDPLPVLAEGPPRLLGPIPWFTATWSPDGTTVAWIEDTSLVVAGADGRSRLPLDTPSSEPIGWLDAGTVMVPGRDGAALVDVATMTVRELPEADGGGHRAVDGGRVVDARLVDGAIRLRWYRADGMTDGPDAVLVDPGRVIRDPPACLDVQPLD